MTTNKQMTNSSDAKKNVYYVEVVVSKQSPHKKCHLLVKFVDLHYRH